MREAFEILGAIIGGLAAVFYFGSMASDAFVASRTYTNPDDVMAHHNMIYIITLGVSVIAGWLIARILSYILIRDK